MEYTITDMELKTHFAEKKIKVFKQICESVSSMSYDEKVKVGTIIFTDDLEIYAQSAITETIQEAQIRETHLK